MAESGGRGAGRRAIAFGRARHAGGRQRVEARLTIVLSGTAVRARKAPGVREFAVLFFVETFARASLVSIVPIQALAILKDAALVSFLYSAVALGALGFGLVVPLLIRRLKRRRVYTLGCLSLIAAATCLATVTLPGQVAGMFLRAAAAAALNITVNIYVLEHIERKDYVRNDAIRLGFSTFGWTLAPSAGVWLNETWGPWAAYGASAACSALLLALFWHFRMTEAPPVRRQPAEAPGPLGNLRRFAEQPRLRLAWTVAFSRSAFWTTFFIYGPILIVGAGGGNAAAGLLVSAGNLLIGTIFLWARPAARFGIRRIAALAFFGSAVFLVPAGLAGSASPWLFAACLLGATVFVVPLDAIGGVPFYRAVRPFERAEMTAVYRTYIDAAELLPTIVYGILLLVLPLGAVFVALAVLHAATGLLCLRHIHPRLR